MENPIASPASSTYTATPVTSNKPRRPRIGSDSEPETATPSVQRPSADCTLTEDVGVSGKLYSPTNLFADGAIKPLSLFNQVVQNNLTIDQQQQLLSSSDQRMSKEKQKFFRSSAFNSDRTIKSPPKPHNAWSVNTPRQPTPVRHMFNDERDRNYKKVRNKGEARRKKIRKHAVDSSSTTSGSSSEEDGEAEEDESSSNTCSSSESASSSSENEDEDTYSSSFDSEGERKQDDDRFGLFTSAANMPTWTSLNGSNNKNTAKAFGCALNGFQQLAAGGSTRHEREWGFAAEAKKNVDVFCSTTKVFGSAASVNDVQLNNNNNNTSSKHAGRKKDAPRKRGERTKNNQLDGLFDGLSQFFQTTDINRQKLKQKKNKAEKKSELPPVTTTTTTTTTIFKETRRTFRDYENSLRRKSLDFPLNANQYSSNLVKNSELPKHSRRSGNKLPNFAILSSDDDFSQLSPSKLVKRAISYKKYEKVNSNIFMPPASPGGHTNNQSGSGTFSNAGTMLDFASLVKSSPSLASVTPHLVSSSGGENQKAGRSSSDSVPPYSNLNTKIGKTARYVLAEI